jgi:threonylcarbamoyladenosine tRNA methylthiotransferase MtaB
MKYKIYSLGCKVNQYDGEKLSGLLKSAGFILGEKDVDVIAVNTCAVTKSAITKSRQAINRARRENPRAKIIIAGCWPKVYKKELKKEVKADLVFDNANFKIEKIKKLFEKCKLKIKNSKAVNCHDLLSTNKDRSRYFLKVQDGCEQFCSYCIIPYARGPLQSRRILEILNEAEAAVASGWREIVLTGIHLGLFGINNKDKKKEEKNAIF